MKSNEQPPSNSQPEITNANSLVIAGAELVMTQLSVYANLFELSEHDQYTVLRMVAGLIAQEQVKELTHQVDDFSKFMDGIEQK